MPQNSDHHFSLPSLLRIGWVGTGVMGSSLCGHLVDKGFEVTVSTRTPSKAKPLLDKGARWVGSSAQVTAQANVVFTMVGFPSDVREIYFGKAGLLNEVLPSTVLVDMTTSEPSLAVEIYEAARAKGAYAVDAPVSGGDVGARNGTLSIMVGGDSGVVEALRPLFEVMGKTTVHQGRAGSGQHTKLCNQITIAGTMVGVCESLLYGYKAGLDLETMLQSIRGGAASCWTLDNLAPRILKRNFDPGFFVDHFVKDMGMALDEAKRMGLILPGLALVQQLYLAVQAHGHGKAGTHALMLALEHLSKVEVKKREA